MFLTLYLHTQCYGGPEEGGWWYDHADLAEGTPSIALPNIGEDDEPFYVVARALNAMEDAAEKHDEAYGYTSVLSSGGHRRWTLESERGANVTTTRPHYE